MKASHFSAALLVVILGLLAWAVHLGNFHGISGWAVATLFAALNYLRHRDDDRWRARRLAVKAALKPDPPGDKLEALRERTREKTAGSRGGEGR